MTLKLSFWRHFQKTWILAIYCIIIVFLLWAVDFDGRMLLFGVIIAGALIIPTVIIHLNHYKHCKKRIIILSEDMVKIEEPNVSWRINANDIKSITVYMSGARYLNLAIQSFPFENYFYCRIDTYSNGTLFLSSLFSNKLDKLLAERYKATVVKRRKYYPLINEISHDLSL